MENSKQKQTAKMTQKTAAILYLFTSKQQPDLRIERYSVNTKKRIIIIKIPIKYSHGSECLSPKTYSKNLSNSL